MIPWKQLAIALLIFAAGWLAKGLADANRITEITSALQRNLIDYNAKVVDASRAEAERVMEALSKSDAQRVALSRDVQTIIKEVQLAPATTDCVTSPAMRTAVDRLRALSEASGPGHQ